MKSLLVIMLVAISTLSNAQSSSYQVSYVTPNKDTLYVTEDMYKPILTIWQLPEYIDAKPVIIKVDSVEAIAALIKTRRDED
jgi:hypothetical protein